MSYLFVCLSAELTEEKSRTIRFQCGDVNNETKNFPVRNIVHSSRFKINFLYFMAFDFSTLFVLPLKRFSLILLASDWKLHAHTMLVFHRKYKPFWRKWKNWHQVRNGQPKANGGVGTVKRERSRDPTVLLMFPLFSIFYHHWSYRLLMPRLVFNRMCAFFANGKILKKRNFAQIKKRNI